MSDQIRSFIKEMAGVIIVAFILAMILRAFVIEGRVIPTGSMLPTIREQDRVMVNKFIYYFKEIQRGDVVVFDPPEALKSEIDYIKRVIGLPGETVEIKEGKVFIDGRALEEPYLNEGLSYEYGPVVVPEDSLFVLGDNRNSSYDSHRWNAWLTQDRVKGKAFLIYWPINHITLLERGVSFIEDTSKQ
ncbi:MAG: signal peptidase I [Syntrophomonadaceae bacterium]|jgi:signal peptidase I